jgi:hypothetical protein
LIAAPVAFPLAQNFPNPFNPSTTFQFTLTRPSPVRLTVFNVLVQIAKTVIDAPLEKGTRAIVWDGTDDNFHPVSSGLFVCGLLSQGATVQR